MIYGPLALGLPIDDPGAAGRAATRRGTTGRSRSSTRSRPIGCACSRSCPATRPRPRRPSSSAARSSATAARSSTSSRSTSATRPGTGSGRPRRAHRPADQLPPQGRDLVGAQLPDGQVAVGRVRHGPAAAARRAARDDDVLAARSSGTPTSRSCWRSRASAGCRTSSPRADLRVAEPCATRSTTSPDDPAERAVPPPGDRDLRGGRAGAELHPAARRRLVHVGVGLSAHRQHLPELAARDRGDARRAARSDRRKITATNCAELYRLAPAS